jgi:hypothetical protein
MPTLNRRWAAACVLALLCLLQLQLVLSDRRNSITWDEAHHLFSGYMSWKQADFGLNPEVPPLVKMLAAAPLLRMPLHVPKLQGRPFQTECFLDGKDFVFKNDAGRLLFRARMAVSVLTLLLALLIFFAAQEMFSTGAALFALALFVLDPNLLAHGALVTTDAGAACLIFAAIYAFYRYAKRPSAGRLLVVSLATGMAILTKFTGILVIPMFVLLAVREIAARPALERKRNALQWLYALAAMGAIVYVMIWAAYGFRYAARPNGFSLHPPLAEYLQQVPSSSDAHLLASMARVHLLPESFLYGLANTKITAEIDPSYFFGRVYPHGTWLYFPAAFLIKSTVPLLALCGLALAAILMCKLKQPRELWFLLLPPALYFLVAMRNHMDIGARHLLPIYPFLYILGAGAAWAFLRADRRWAYVLAVLLLWQAITSVRVFPAYMAYANELWGGPAKTHLYLSDANVDWGQQLIATRQYLEQHNIQHCWFAYFPAGAIDPADYGIPCKLLPTADTLWWLDEVKDTPASIDGPVLISDSDLAGIEFGDGPLNPYGAFQSLKPSAVIQYGVYVYDGHFNIPLAAGLTHTQRAEDLLRDGQPQAALAEAQQAVALAPRLVNSQAALGDALLAMHRPEEARARYETALHLAETVRPELQTSWLPVLHAAIQKCGAWTAAPATAQDAP